MRTIYVNMHKPQEPRVIDITPQPWWRRASRVLMVALTVVVVVPVLWFLGGLFLLLLLGAAAVMLAVGSFHLWRLERARRPRSGGDLTDLP
jgi:hypothetical protein